MQAPFHTTRVVLCFQFTAFLNHESKTFLQLEWCTCTCFLRKPFEFHNRLDALLMLALVGYTTGFVAASLDFDRDQVSPMVYYGISATLTLTPLVYFIVCFLRLSKRIEAWSTCPPLCDYNRPPAIDHRQSYEDLSTSEELHLSVN